MKNTLFLLVSVAWLTASVLAASAQELRIFADKAFQPALKEIKPLFIQQTGFAVDISWGHSPALAEKIVRTATPPDVFFPATEGDMQLVVQKGLVDVALKRNIVVVPSTAPVEEGVAPETEYTSAAVLLNATNRLQAMAFLEFLTSEPARAAFARQGFALP
mgnify:FL=1